jgi:hypothetical protein
LLPIPSKPIETIPFEMTVTISASHTNLDNQLEVSQQVNPVVNLETNPAENLQESTPISHRVNQVLSQVGNQQGISLPGQWQWKGRVCSTSPSAIVTF